MNWQDIAVIIAVGTAFILLVGRLIRRGSKSSSDGCSSCSESDCPLRDLKSRSKHCNKQ
ncbi:MAG: hypothetical protein IJ998_08070 [Alistipes sp.]|nr:hypothetical protein [Alistipes sp.]